MPDDGGWRRRASRYLYRSRWFHVRQDEITLPAGEEITYTWIEHGGFVVIVPLLDDGRVVMERVFRWTLGRTALECPSGGRDGEAPETAARRELEEETGYRAGAVAHLGRFVASSGISNEAYDCFLATGLRPGGRIQRESTEQIELELIPLEVLREMWTRGGIEDGPTALALRLAWERARGVPGRGGPTRGGCCRG
jgi:ADP-ribose pyrophosphatase